MSCEEPPEIVPTAVEPDHVDAILAEVDKLGLGSFELAVNLGCDKSIVFEACLAEVRCDCDELEPRPGWKRLGCKRRSVACFGANEAGCGVFESVMSLAVKGEGVGAIPGVKVPFVGDDAGSTVGLGLNKEFAGLSEVAGVEKRDGLLVLSFCCGNS